MSELLLLGSGSADGWPNPWCRCASCQWARDTGTLRSRTSALLDGRILIDPGPDLTTRAGTGPGCPDLAEVELVLVTHAHPDHFDPSFLLAREWAVVGGFAGPLLVAGPPTVVAAARDWVCANSPVQFRELVAGDTLANAGWQIRALPAAHNLAGTNSYDATALLYELTHQRGRMLWATDTAALPHDHLSGRYDLVALELTFGEKVDHGTAHLDLPAFAAEIAELRRRDRLTPGARVVAVHLSHHNPPNISQRLAPIGALAGEDLAVYQLRGQHASMGAVSSADRIVHRVAERRTTPARVFVTGGARSGKSRRAEALARDLAMESGRQVIYVATAPRSANDPEWASRVAAHQARRPAHWHTHETADLASELAGATNADLLLIDCLTLWLTRVIDDAQAWDDPDRARKVADQAVTAVLAALAGASCAVVIVSNEVGSGVVPATPSGRLFQDLLGMANSRVAAACGHVELLVAGHPIQLRRPGAPHMNRKISSSEGIS